MINENKEIFKDKIEKKIDISQKEEFPLRQKKSRTFTSYQESIPKKRKKKPSLREIVQQRKQQERWKRLKDFFILFFTRFG